MLKLLFQDIDILRHELVNLVYHEFMAKDILCPIFLIALHQHHFIMMIENNLSKMKETYKKTPVKQPTPHPTEQVQQVQATVTSTSPPTDL